jgi:hypothetical protein
MYNPRSDFDTTRDSMAVTAGKMNAVPTGMSVKDRNIMG